MLTLFYIITWATQAIVASSTFHFHEEPYFTDLFRSLLHNLSGENNPEGRPSRSRAKALQNLGGFVLAYFQ